MINNTCLEVELFSQNIFIFFFVFKDLIKCWLKLMIMKSKLTCLDLEFSCYIRFIKHWSNIEFSQIFFLVGIQKPEYLIETIKFRKQFRFRFRYNSKSNLNCNKSITLGYNKNILVCSNIVFSNTFGYFYEIILLWAGSFNIGAIPSGIFATTKSRNLQLYLKKQIMV